MDFIQQTSKTAFRKHFQTLEQIEHFRLELPSLPNQNSLFLYPLHLRKSFTHFLSNSYLQLGRVDHQEIRRKKEHKTFDWKWNKQVGKCEKHCKMRRWVYILQFIVLSLLLVWLPGLLWILKYCTYWGTKTPHCWKLDHTPPPTFCVLWEGFENPSENFSF